MLIFLYRVYYVFAVPVCFTVYYNLQTQYSLYTSENPIVTDSASPLTSSHIINMSYGGLVSKAKGQGLVV